MKNFTVNQVNAAYVANEMVNYFMAYAKDSDEVNGLPTMYVGNSALEFELSKYRVKCSYFTNNSRTYVVVEWSLKSNNRYNHTFTTKREFNKSLHSLKDDEVRNMVKECITEGFGNILEEEAITTFLRMPNNSIEVDEQGNTSASPIAFNVHPYILGKYHLNEVLTFWVVPQENTISLGGVTISYDKSRAYKEFNIIMDNIITAWYENEVKEVKESFNTPNDAEVVAELTEVIKNIKNNCTDLPFLNNLYKCGDIELFTNRLDYCTVRLNENPRNGWVLDIDPRFEDDKQGGWCVPLMYDTDVIINKIIWIENSYRLSKAMFVHNYDMGVAYNEVISETKVAHSIEQLDDILTMVKNRTNTNIVTIKEYYDSLIAEGWIKEEDYDCQDPYNIIGDMSKFVGEDKIKEYEELCYNADSGSCIDICRVDDGYAVFSVYESEYRKSFPADTLMTDVFDYLFECVKEDAKERFIDILNGTFEDFMNTIGNDELKVDVEDYTEHANEDDGIELYIDWYMENFVGYTFTELIDRGYYRLYIDDRETLDEFINEHIYNNIKSELIERLGWMVDDRFGADTYKWDDEFCGFIKR